MLIIGVDYSVYGENTQIVKITGLNINTQQIVHLQHLPVANASEAVSIISGICEKLEPQAVCVDAVGFGAAVVQGLKEAEIPKVIGLHF